MTTDATPKARMELKIEPSLKEKLTAQAKKEKRSLNNLVEVWLGERMQAEEDKEWLNS